LAVQAKAALKKAADQRAKNSAKSAA
jgi:hypothetical protein